MPSLQVEESNQALASQLGELAEGLQGTINLVESAASAYLRRDDELLERLAAVSVLDADDGKELKTKVDQLSAKMSELTREEIECRLGRIYLQHLFVKEAGSNHEQEGRDELEQQELELELELDLKSLHIEIPDVAEMATFQDFKAALLRVLAEQQNRKNDRARTVLKDVCAPILLRLWFGRLTDAGQRFYDSPYRGSMHLRQSSRSSSVASKGRFSVSRRFQRSSKKVYDRSRRSKTR
jgi:hypothetical protein